MRIADTRMHSAAAAARPVGAGDPIGLPGTMTQAAGARDTVQLGVWARGSLSCVRTTTAPMIM